jgi:pyruvyltransferase
MGKIYIYYIFSKYIMNIVYWNTNNLGDLANIYIGLSYNYTKFKPIVCNTIQNNSIFLIGSILRFCGSNNIIFGSGLKDSTESIKVGNNKLYCVRGKLTKNELLKNSNLLMIDPGLLIRKLYIPRIIPTKKKLLIIPHYNHKLLFNKETSEYDILNIQFNANDYSFIIKANYTSNDDKKKLLQIFNSKFDIINSYDLILSSSLHGLVFAHAFNKKTIYFEINDFKNEPVHKYNDYYSIYNMTVQPVKINKTDIPNIKYSNYINNKSHNVDITKYEKLINDASSMFKGILNHS